MGIAERVVPELRLTVVVWHGVVTPSDTIEHLVRLAGNRCFPPGDRHITDIRTATNVGLPTAGVLDPLFDDTDLRNDDLEKVVIIVPTRRDAGSGIKDAAADLGLHAMPFTDIEPACTHLGVDAIAVQEIINELRAGIIASESA